MIIMMGDGADADERGRDTDFDHDLRGGNGDNEDGDSGGSRGGGVVHGVGDGANGVARESKRWDVVGTLGERHVIV